MAGGGAKWLVSRGGGMQPQWSADGRQLYYIALDRRLMVVDVRADGAVFTPSSPVGLMETRYHRVGAVGRRVLRGGAGWQPRAREHLYRHWPPCLADAELAGAGSLTPVNRGSLNPS